MGSVADQWHRKVDGKRVRSDRYGRGKRWLARWTDQSGRKTAQAFASKDEAVAHLARVDVDVRSGTYVAPSKVTFGEWAAVWRPRQVHWRDSTGRSHDSRLNAHLMPALGERRLGELTRADVADLIVSMTAKGSGPRTVRQAHVLLVQMLADAVHEKLVPGNVAVGVTLPKPAKAPVVPLTAAQVRTLREGIPEHLRVAVDLGVASGMRSAELRGLTWDRVNGDTVTVDRQLSRAPQRGLGPVWGPPKTAAGHRKVVLDGRTVGALHAHRAEWGDGPAGLVLSTTWGKAVSQAAFADAWRDASAGMNLPDRSGWHALRHFHASMLISEGVSVRGVADRLGHDDPGVTLRVYAHLMPDDTRRAVAAVSARWWDEAEAAVDLDVAV